MFSKAQLSSVLWFVAAVALLLGMGLLPAERLDNRAQVLLEATRAALGLWVLTCWLGWPVCGLLLPTVWRKYELLLVPLVGAATLISAAYYLSLAWDMRSATALLCLGVVPLAVWRVLGGVPGPQRVPELAVPVATALALVAAAVAPHVIQGSLGLLAISGDEENYYCLAQYLLAYPAGSSFSGPPAPVFGLDTPGYRAEGWGFQYLLAAASAISGVTPFHAYLPTTYMLLGMAALAWYVFYREELRLPARWAASAVGLFALHGLPLWFVLYGYARQEVWAAFAPLVLSSLALAFRGGGTRAILTAGLAAAALLNGEIRVGATHLAVTVLGLGLYWVVVDRSPVKILRMGCVAFLAAIVSAPALQHFVSLYILHGRGVAVLGSGPSDWATYGPGLGGIPPIEVALGLEPNELARIPERIAILAWMDPINGAMSALAPYLAYIVLLVTCIGVLAAFKQNALSLPLTGGFFVWLAATGLILAFPYGYFKMLNVAVPLLLGYLATGASWLWSRLDNGCLPSGSLRRHCRTLAMLSCLLFVLFLARNGFHTLLFGARGWGLSIPASLVRDVVEFGRVAEPGAKVFVTGASRYPVPERLVKLRKAHRLAMQTREELSIVWAERMHGLISASLIGREVYGNFRTQWFEFARSDPKDDYDFYVLTSEEDPRLRGLDAIDLVAEGEGVKMYRAPQTGRASSEQILAARATLRVDTWDPLVFHAGVMDLALGAAETGRLRPGTGRVQLGLMALAETPIQVRAGHLLRTLVLDPGVSWYTTPDLSFPTELRLAPTGDDAVRVVALRVLPPGAEDLDRSSDGFLSAETLAGVDGVSIEIWFSNPMRDAKGAEASLSVGAERRKLALGVHERGERWLIYFPLSGDGPVQLQDGSRRVPMERLPWHGGTLSLQFGLGRERPRVVPLATISVEGGQIARLDRYVDPVQLRLWGYDDRPKEKQPPDLSHIEGKLVRSTSGFVYAVLGGRRHWVPEPTAVSLAGEMETLTPEQLWMIPPGLPLATSSHELDPSGGKQHHPQQ